MALDPDKKQELVERLKAARQKKLDLKKQKDITEVKQPMIEKPAEVQGDTLTPIPVTENKTIENLPTVEKKENLKSPKNSKDKEVGEKTTKSKFMKIVFYKQPKQKTIGKIQSVLDSDSDDEIKLPAKVKPVKTPRVKEEIKPTEPKLNDRQAYLKQLASMYY